MATNKLLWSSKLIGVFFIMLVCTLSANAQFLRTSYFMEGTHYRQQLNPALTPTKGYFNLPVIGAVNATVGSTSLGYQDIIDIIDDGDDFYTKPDFMNRLKDNNKLNVNFSTEILSAGWYKGKNFWSFVSVSAILSCRPFFILIFLRCIKMKHYGFSRKSIWKNLETFP